MIAEKILEAKGKKIKQWPVRSNRASDMGHECLRYLVLNRTRWQEKSPHDARLQMIFDLGHVFEDVVMGDLREAGFRVLEQQRPFSWDKYQITGSIDGKLLINGVAVPFEVKSSSPYVFKTIETIEDMKHHKYHYMRKYISQLTLYLLMGNQERGVFLFVNKSLGEIKDIWLDLDYALGEQLLQKAEAINQHIAKGTLPEPMEYNEDICGSCPYAHICMPDRIGKEVEVTDDTELIGLLDRYAVLKPMAKEYKETDDRIKTLVEGREKILAGDWFIEGKWREATTYDIPAEIKQAYKGTIKYWLKKIMRVPGTEAQ